MKRFFTLALVAVTLLLLVNVQSAPAGETALGLAPHGKNALEFIGRSIQEGESIIHYGYFSFIYELDKDVLFSESGNQNERTARFTYYATSTLDARHENRREDGNVIVTSAPTEMAIYFNDTPGGDFNDPDSFKSGRVIATFEGRYHNILNIQAPNVGDTSATADLTQNGISVFRLNGQKYVLGHKGLRERTVITGRGKKTQDEPLQSSFLLGGYITVER